MDLIKRFLGAIAGSKKAVAAVSAAVFIFLAPVLTRLGVEVTPEEKADIIKLVIAYLVGQGLADVGKSKAIVEAAAVASDDEPAEPVEAPPTEPLKAA
jgi:uncharacterized membrane protein